MRYTNDMARTGRPKYEDETGGRVKTVMLWVTEGEKSAMEEAAAIAQDTDEPNVSDWLRELALARAKRVGVRLPKQR